MRFSKGHRNLNMNLPTGYPSLTNNSASMKSISLTKLPQIRRHTKHLLADLSHHPQSEVPSANLIKFKSQADLNLNKRHRFRGDSIKLAKSSKRIAINKQNVEHKNHENVEVEITSIEHIKSPRQVDKEAKWMKLTEKIQMNMNTDFDEWSNMQENIISQYYKKSQELNHDSIRIQLQKYTIHRQN